MTRWEYKIVPSLEGHDDVILDDAGLAGWELTAVVSVTDGRLLYLKRPIINDGWSR